MKLPHRDNGFEFVPIRDLQKHPLFANLPYKYLEYHDRTVVRRRFGMGEIVCREGDYGSTAYLIIGGDFEVIIEAPSDVVIEREPSSSIATSSAPMPSLGTWLESAGGLEGPGPEATTVAPPLPSHRASSDRAIIRTKDDLIIGEMSCLSHHPRTATICARSEGAEIWEIRRNFLDALRRNRKSRALLDSIYRDRAVPDLLRRAKLFASLSDADRDAVVAHLLPRVDFVRVDSGRVVFEQGQPADHFYLVRLGFVKVARKSFEGELVLDYLGPNSQFGEIGLLTSTSVDYLPDGPGLILPPGFARGTRTATLTALDDVELVRVRGDDFHELSRMYSSFRDVVVRQALEYIRKNEQEFRKPKVESLALAVENGLFNANSLLVLDLEKCTRCDECTKACADSHDGVSRLMRDGIRYGNFLVATSCRSCQNPYCLAGCPVDAIHRRPPNDERAGLEIVIEPWCIGCGRCEQNCPYGNISMHEYLEQVPSGGVGGPTRLKSRPSLAARVRLAGLRLLGRFHPRFRVGQKAVVRSRAVTCDLCRDTVHDSGQEVACVYACPHDAAHRMSGSALIERVRETTSS
jgi:CRP-like cAMP-binding protein/Fe-S-cluster-containing hydrogenase component 2